MLKKKKVSNEFDKSALTYFKEIGKYSPLSQQEEYDLWHKYKFENDIDARNKLVSSNLRFVASVAKNYQGRGLSYSDLIAEGNMGLLKAIDKFDGDKGYKAISYSVWWIRQTILEALQKRNCTDSEDLPNDNINADDEGDSLNEKIENSKNFFIADDNTIDDKEKKEVIDKLMRLLTDRERQVIIEYYGLDGNEPMTLEEIGKELGLTKERVRQINEKSLKKLRYEALLTNSVD